MEKKTLNTRKKPLNKKTETKNQKTKQKDLNIPFTLFAFDKLIAFLKTIGYNEDDADFAREEFLCILQDYEDEDDECANCTCSDSCDCEDYEFDMDIEEETDVEEDDEDVEINFIVHKPYCILKINDEKYISKMHKKEKSFDKEKGLMMCLLKMAGIDYPTIEDILKNNTTVVRDKSLDKDKKKLNKNNKNKKGGTLPF